MRSCYAILCQLRSCFTLGYGTRSAVALVFEAMQHQAGSASQPLPSRNWTGWREVHNRLQCKMILIFWGYLWALEIQQINIIGAATMAHHLSLETYYILWRENPNTRASVYKCKVVHGNVKSYILGRCDHRSTWRLAPTNILQWLLCRGIQLRPPRFIHTTTIEAFTWEGHLEECAVIIILMCVCVCTRVRARVCM